MHDMRVDDRGARMEGLTARALDVPLVDRLQPADLTVLVGDQRLPVETRLRHRPAIAGGVGKMLGKLRGIDIKFLRHAAPYDAGAAETVFLGNTDPLAECRRHASR